VSSLSISGFYFLTGWVSKDAILLAMFRSSSPLLGLSLFYAGALLTMTYCVRLCYSCFSADASIVPLCSSSRSPCLVFVPSLSLLILSVLEGWVLTHSLSLQCPVVCGIDMFVLLVLFVLS
jgi:NADH:ubiquinone oxidoreductase subunit 5 (subunit L)/multisubunit Na+/H+ antiporter MnhA subunit